jgi:hypothetical protein
MQLEKTARENQKEADQRVEVVFSSDLSAVGIKYLTWTDGLGWSTQKTIWIDSSDVDDLHRAISAARIRLKHAQINNNDTAKVISFPAP